MVRSLPGKDNGVSEASDADELKAVSAALKRHLQRRQRAGIRFLTERISAELKSAGGGREQAGIVDDLFAEAVAGMQANTLEELRAAIGDCQRCKLCTGRTHIVFGVGNPQA